MTMRSGCLGGVLGRDEAEEEGGCRRRGRGGGGGVNGRVMGWKRKAVTNYCRLRGGNGIGKWRENRIGRTEDAACPRCGEGDG